MSQARSKKQVNDSFKKMFFLYDKLEGKFVFTNSPEATIFYNNDSSFFKTKNPADWLKIVSLENNEEYDFSIPAGNTTPSFQVNAQSLSTVTLPLSSLILLTVQHTQENTGPSSEPGIIERLRKEQQVFIDTAAHDLDSPLRKLSFLIERLSEKCKGDEVAEYQRRIKNSLGDMRALIDNLTALSHAGSDVPTFSTIDAALLAKQTWQDLMQKTDTGAQLEISDIPLIHGDHVQLGMLFRQIFSNAIKFAQAGKPAQVNMRGAMASREEIDHLLPGKEGVFVRIEISDNGIGFPGSDSEKIFEPFLRLHPKSEYNGNGLGLAISKKIVANHGGTIYAEGKENHGSRIILILPANP
jgi:signal transduction histidine kinase